MDTAVNEYINMEDPAVPCNFAKLHIGSLCVVDELLTALAEPRYSFDHILARQQRGSTSCHNRRWICTDTRSKHGY
jgi:hypothetical protein